MEGRQVSSGFFVSPARDAAERIVANMKRSYGATPVFVRTSESEFAHLDLDVYRRFRDTLERRGYRFLSDVKMPGISDYPGSRTVPTMIRSMVSPDGATCASHYQFTPKFRVRVTTVLGGLLTLAFIARPGRLLFRSLMTKHIDDFESEIAGAYVVTTNAEAAQAFSLPESVDAKFFPYGTPVEVVRAAHEARLKAAIQRTGCKPTSMTTIEDVFALETRLKQCKNAHRAASNWVTQNELRAASGGNTALADAIFKGVQTVLAESS
jgi:hypothetical protein